MTTNDAQLIGLQKYGKKRGFPKEVEIKNRPDNFH